MIEHYSFGKMTVNGAEYENDLKILGGEVKPEWWRRDGHYCDLNELKDVVESNPKVLVLGTGANGVMKVDPKLEGQLREENIELIAKPTGEAVKDFNRLVEEGADVAGAFHLTC
jgi:hypothetical protein